MERHDVPKKWSKVTGTAFDVIEALDDLGGATVTELADHLDLAASTVHNHLGALQRRDYVVNQDGTYKLGLRFLTLGISVRDDHELPHVARPVVQDIAEKTGESAWAATLESDMIVFLCGSNGSDGVQTYGRIGARRHPHANASGKVILAHLPKETVNGILDRTGLPRFTENTITSRDALFDELESIREQGFAVNRAEYLDSGRAVACAVLQNGYPIGALGVSGPAHRFQGERLTDELPSVLFEGKNIVELELSSPPESSA